MLTLESILDAQKDMTAYGEGQHFHAGGPRDISGKVIVVAGTIEEEMLKDGPVDVPASGSSVVATAMDGGPDAIIEI